MRPKIPRFGSSAFAGAEPGSSGFTGIESTRRDETLRGESPLGGYAALGVLLVVAEGAAREMVFDLRARLGVLIRNEVATTVADPAEVDDEVRYLVSLF